MSRSDAVKNALLTSVAWTGLVLYILGCVSWSPDGSSLVYPYINPEAGESGVAIFERGDEKANVLYLSQAPKDVTPAQWEHEGKRVILWVGEHEILLFPQDGSRPLRRLKVPTDLGDVLFPIPEVDESLFLSGDSLVRVDLRSGETTVRERADKEEVYLFQGDDEVLYTRDLGKGVEIGTLDSASLDFRPRFLIPARLLKEHGLADVGFPSFDPKSGQIAAWAGGDEINTAILLLRNNGLDRVVVPRTTEPRYLLGTLQWSSDGKRIYASMASPRDEGESIQTFVAEIALDDGATRIVPIAPLSADWDSDWGDVFLLQVALSPDGNLIAVSTAALEADDVAPEDRGLYLVDLRDFGSYVQFVPLPEPAHEQRSKEGS